MSWLVVHLIPGLVHLWFSIIADPDPEQLIAGIHHILKRLPRRRNASHFLMGLGVALIIRSVLYA